MAERPSLKEPPSNIYKPLDKDDQEIRLFEILSSEDTNATVELRLFRRRLKDVSGQFIPFSYVWGDAADTKTITVNGTSTEVTRNLADFLKQTRTLLPDIRTKGSWDKPAIFWADAICINQQDTEERNHQVQLLKPIYSSAPLALAWLGHLSNAHLAVSLAESLGQPHGPEFALILPTLDYSSWMHAHPHLWEAPGSGRHNAHWEAFQVLVESPYWSRTWTFQEMVLPTHVLFMCGSSLIMWQSIVVIQQLIAALASMTINPMLPATEAHRALSLAVRHCGTLRPYMEISDARRGIANTSRRPDLTLVPRMATHQTTDPRDKVYSLLGVIETRLEADYTRDTAQIYTEFVSAWIDELKDLNFLLYSDEYHRIARHGPNPLPSWAPDWEAISHKEGRTEIYPNLRIFLNSFLGSYNVSEQLPASNARLSDDLSTLAAPGVVAGKVEEVYPRWPSDMNVTGFALEIIQLVIKYTSCFGSHLEPSGSPPGPRLHIFQVLFRTIITDVDMYSAFQHGNPSLRRSLALCLLVGVLAWAVDSESPDWHSVAGIYLPQLGIPPGQDFSRAWKEEIFKGYSPESNMPDWEDAAAAMEWTWGNAREDVEALRLHAAIYLELPVRFFTDNGNLGIATTAQAGDLVVILTDCSAPMLLRRKGSHYEHAGPCFVVGLMEGEAKQMVDRGEAKIETFEIR